MTGGTCFKVSYLDIQSECDSISQLFSVLCIAKCIHGISLTLCQTWTACKTVSVRLKLIAAFDKKKESDWAN